jgi:hypothetical protein
MISYEQFTSANRGGPQRQFLRETQIDAYHVRDSRALLMMALFT